MTVNLSIVFLSFPTISFESVIPNGFTERDSEILNVLGPKKFPGQGRRLFSVCFGITFPTSPFARQTKGSPLKGVHECPNSGKNPDWSSYTFTCSTVNSAHGRNQ